jgi:hypothetical protein
MKVRSDTERLDWLELTRREVFSRPDFWAVRSALSGMRTGLSLRDAIDAAMDAEEVAPQPPVKPIRRAYPRFPADRLEMKA